MPFELVYHVIFNNGNLQPKFNPRGWPDMVRSPDPSTDPALIPTDPAGLILMINKFSTSQNATDNVYVVPLGKGPMPNGLNLGTRLHMRATFDRPLAEGFPEFSPTLIGNEEEQMPLPPSSDHGAPAEEVELPGGPISHPEPWGVALNVSAEERVPSVGMMNATCQFHRLLKEDAGGVRANTPNWLQLDQAAYLESPLNYDNYNDPVYNVPLFTLEHSFCATNSIVTGHAVGSCHLKITRTWPPPEVRDHRLYSSLPPWEPRGQHDEEMRETRLRALGFTLAMTRNATGRARVRLRSFSVWINDPLP